MPADQFNPLLDCCASSAKKAKHRFRCTAALSNDGESSCKTHTCYCRVSGFYCSALQLSRGLWQRCARTRQKRNQALNATTSARVVVSSCWLAAGVRNVPNYDQGTSADKRLPYACRVVTVAGPQDAAAEAILFAKQHSAERGSYIRGW